MPHHRALRPQRFHTLSAAGIRVYTGASGTVADAVAAFEKGSLKEASSADVTGHW